MKVIIAFGVGFVLGMVLVVSLINVIVADIEQREDRYRRPGIVLPPTQEELEQHNNYEAPVPSEDVSQDKGTWI